MIDPMNLFSLLTEELKGKAEESRAVVNEFGRLLAYQIGLPQVKAIPPQALPVNPRPSDVPNIGYMPSQPQATSDGKVEPEAGVPTETAVVSKIDSESKASFMNLFLHLLWKQVENASDGTGAFQKAKVTSVHIALVEKMLANNWQHVHLDSLDDTLPEHLKKSVLIPQPVSSTVPSPAENPAQPDLPPERSAVVTAPIGLEKDKPFSTVGGNRFAASLPSMQISSTSCVKLTADDAKQMLALASQGEPSELNLPDDALYLLIDAVENGTFNNVELTPEELYRAVPSYQGRMFIEGHDWNDPRKAIGQVLKARVIFREESGKYVMQVLAVVLREDAIKNFERGLYKFVSIGASMKATCSVCNLSVQEGCPHKKGLVYDTPRGKIQCKHFAKDLLMEELSCVNVPACRPAAATGKISIAEARSLLAAAMEYGGEDKLGSMDYMVELQEIIYRKPDKEEVVSMAKWQEDFRIGDAKGYNSLLQKAEEYPHLGRVYGDMVTLKKMPATEDVETLAFAHELLHRWFNQPTRAKAWTEEELAQKHEIIFEQLCKLSADHPSVTIMDEALHAQMSKCADKCGEGKKEECKKPEEKKCDENKCDGEKKDDASGVVEVAKKVLTENGEEKSCGENCDTGKKVAASLTDAEERRAGYQDGVAKAQAGATVAEGKQMNKGADLAKGADYREGYQKGYKESQKSAEPNHVNEQIAKGGIKMSDSQETKVVLTKDEATRSGAVKDLSTRKEQGEIKAEVQKTDPEKQQMPTDKLGEVGIESTHDYDKGEFKPGVQKHQVDKDGSAYGLLKCPECHQDKIMPGTDKCPKCGSAKAKLVPMPIKEEERLGDFPIRKTHSAFDAPPMVAKDANASEAPAMQKSKLSNEGADVITGMQNELHALKAHLQAVNARVDNERDTWVAEKQTLVAERNDLVTKLSAAENELATVKLDLATKDSLYKTVMSENQTLLSKLEMQAKSEKEELVSKIVNTKLSLGLVTDEQATELSNHYSGKTMESLKEIHEEVVAHAKHFASLTMSQKFGAITEGATTTEEGKVSAKEGTVSGTQDAVVKQTKERTETEDKAPALVEKSDNTIFGRVMRSLSVGAKK